MAKWADLCITAVRYSSEHTHIDRVRARPDLGEELGPEAEYTRSQIVSFIEGGKTVITVYRDPPNTGNWKKGAKVEVVVIEGTKYLRTDNNRVKKDNLGNLPEF